MQVASDDSEYSKQSILEARKFYRQGVDKMIIVLTTAGAGLASCPRLFPQQFFVAQPLTTGWRSLHCSFLQKKKSVRTVVGGV